MADITISPGDIPTAAQWNSYMLHTGSAWNTWTPVVTQGATPTLSITEASYHRTGRLITFQCLVTTTSAGTAANDIVLTLPVASKAYVSQYQVLGQGMLNDISATLHFFGPLISISTTTAKIAATGPGATFAYLGSSAFTAALANTDTIAYYGSYEAASG